MSNGLKQRIIGALVLGALGLIILPIIFDFADPLKIDRTRKLPAARKISPVDVARAQRPDSSAKLAETDMPFLILPNPSQPMPLVRPTVSMKMTCPGPGCYAGRQFW